MSADVGDEFGTALAGLRAVLSGLPREAYRSASASWTGADGAGITLTISAGTPDDEGGVE